MKGLNISKKSDIIFVSSYYDNVLIASVMLFLFCFIFYLYLGYRDKNKHHVEFTDFYQDMFCYCSNENL